MVRYFLAVSFLGTSLAAAATLSSESELGPDNTLINFESLSPGQITPAPLVIGEAIFSSTSGLYIQDVSSYTPSSEVSGKVLYTGSNAGLIRIDFASPVGQVGMGFWELNFSDSNFLRVYNSSDTLLESVALPGVPTGGAFAVFRGISRSTNDIKYAVVEFSDLYPYYGIDNVSFGPAVPEPSVSALVAAGSMMFVFARNLRRKAAR